MSLDANQYLKKIIPDCSPDTNPLEIIKRSSPTDINNIFSNILRDMHQISVNPTGSLNLLVNSIMRLYTIILTCSCIEDVTCNDLEGFEEFKANTFTHYRNSLKNLGFDSTEKIEYCDQISEIVSIAKQYINLEIKSPDGRTQMHLACYDGNLEKVKFLLSIGASVTDLDSNGRTPLYIAILNGHEECAKFIILNYPNIDIAEEDMLCLNLACSKGFKEIAELLMNKGADLNAVDVNGMTPIAQAIINGKQECARLLIENKADIVKTLLLNEAPLELAINKGLKSIIDLLVANINACDKDGNTMLRVAVNRFVLNNYKDSSSLEFCKFLISQGALINIRDRIGKTPLHIAAELGADLILKELLKSPDANAIINEQDDDGNTLLHTAVDISEEANDEQLNRSLECVKLLIQHNARIDIFNKINETPLHIAAKRDFYDAFDELLKLPKAFEIIDTQDEDGDTLLHSIINVDIDAYDLQKERALESVRLLIQHNARFDIPNRAFETPLHLAIKVKFYDAFEKLFELPGASAIIDKQDGDGNTLLYIAMDVDEKADDEELHRALECVKLLIKHKARVDIPNKIGQIAIHGAVVADFSEALKELLKLPEVIELIDVKDVTNDSALCIAVNVKEDADDEKLERSLENVKLLIEHNAKVDISNKEQETPIFIAARRCFYEALEELLKLPAAIEIIDAQDEYGNTPLHAILSTDREDDEKLQRNFEIVKLLIDHKAKVNIPNKADKIPLHIASENGFYIALEELLKIPEARDYINAQDENGSTPLLSAIKNGYEECANLLIQTNADINIANKFGISPIIAACKGGYKGILELIINSVDNINVRDIYGGTPLYYAIENGHIDCVQFLMDKGADVTIADNNDVTPLHLVCEKGYSDLIKELLDRGADPDAYNNDGISPFYKSIIFRNEKCTLALYNRVQITDIPNKYNNSIFSALLRNCDISFYMKIVKSVIACNKVGLQRQDGFGNTPLHYACKHGSRSLLKLLIEKLNPRNLIEKNIYYETPLQLAFDPELWKKYPKKMIEFISLILDGFSDFFKANNKSIIRNIRARGISGFSSYLQKKIKKLLKNPNDVSPLIISLFLNDYALAQKVKYSLTKEQFEGDLNAVALKFSPAAEEFCKLQNFFHDISEFHLQKGLIQIPEEKADGVELNDLLKMFDTLYDIYSEEITPENFRGKSKEYLREILEGFIEKVKNRTSYTGTPGLPDELEKFYSTIEIAQTHIINKLRQTDSKRQVEILKKLIEEVHLCGGKIYTISEQLFREVCQKESLNFESQLYHRLANLREMSFSSQIPSGPQSVHDSNILMHHLGLECGIPGGHVAREFSDDYVGEGVNIDLAKIGFFKRYNSYAIASFINEQCRDSDFMDLCLDWIVENIEIPAKWNQAWDELIQNKGKISEMLGDIQKKILKTLLDINSGDINWEDLNDLEESKSDTFKGSQRISIDSEVMVMILIKCGVITNIEVKKENE